jgi:serine/threonine protein kinase
MGQALNHPLVVHIRRSLSDAIVTEFAENGSLADHLSDTTNGNFCRLSDPTRIMRIIAGIVLAMRFLHSQNVVHRDLTPENILIDFDWNVRICDFGCSVSPVYSQPVLPMDHNRSELWRTIDCRYGAPECFRNMTVPASEAPQADVFSFGLILYELIIGRPVFPKDIHPYKVAAILGMDDWRPCIPDDTIPEAADLIRDCLAINYRDRPSFIDIVHRLKAVGFKLMPGVNSEKINKFVNKIEATEVF